MLSRVRSWALSSFALPVLVTACGSGPTVIDARRDGSIQITDGAPDDAAPPSDGGGLDGGGLDGGGPDAGCLPPTLAPWVPVDTMGPDGEAVLDCVARVGSETDDRLPLDQGYDLTTFGGPGDEQPVSCAGAADADGSWYYAANAQRFPCGQRVRIVDEARSACVVVEVADIGPNACVEEAGARPIWDVSPLAAQHLFGVSAVGWSEHLAVRGAPVGSANPLGPCDADLAAPRDFLRGFIGGPCDSPGDCTDAAATCMTDGEGWPGGTCTQDCVTSCPDRAGPYAFTACADLDDGTRRCLPRCDFTLFEDGCREGYGCERRPHPTGAGADRWVCLPLACG